MSGWMISEFREQLKTPPEVYQDISEGRQFHAGYLLMLVLAALIALLGLLQNSVAVIIGAMLISPLMGPILSCGLALTLADWKLGKKALRNVGLSVAEVIVITALATWLAPLKEATPEILARTSPNLMDLLIAVFSGLAGSLALCSKKTELTILPGVAIAVAVMPPLATTGYGLSTQQWAIARGSFLLFFTNLVAIVISAHLVFVLVGFRARLDLSRAPHRLLVRYRTLIAYAVLVVVALPLMQTLVRAARQTRMKTQITRTLKASLERGRESRLGGVDFVQQADHVSVDALVRTARLIPNREIQQLERDLSAQLGQPVRLSLEQLRLAEDDAAKVPAKPSGDFIAGGVVHPQGPSKPELLSASLAEVQRRLQESLATLLQPAGLKNLAVISVEKTPKNEVVVGVSAETQEPADPVAWQVAAAALAREAGAPIRLQATLLVSREAAFDLQFQKDSARLSTAELRRLRTASAAWPKGPGLEIRFAGAAPPDSPLSQQRRRRLQVVLGDRPLSPAPAAVSDLASDVLRLTLQQKFEVAAPLPAVAPAAGQPAPAPSAS